MRWAYDPSHLEWTLGLKRDDHTRYRYVYIFDRGYCFQRHLDALEASEEDVQCISAVGDTPLLGVKGAAEMLRVRDSEELSRLAKLSPLFEWLAKTSFQQPADETWGYFFGQPTGAWPR